MRPESDGGSPRGGASAPAAPVVVVGGVWGAERNRYHLADYLGHGGAHPHYPTRLHVGVAGGSGAGHAGEGADGCGPIARAGGARTLGSLALPFSYGSGGGSGSLPRGGGRGGGRIRIRWSGLVRIEGRLSANGQNGSCTRSTVREFSGGGGAAGSIQIYADTIQGEGALELVGGHVPKHCNLWDLYAGGGGGGGGRMVVASHRNISRLRAYMGGGESGGEECLAGGAGTLLLPISPIRSCSTNGTPRSLKAFFLNETRALWLCWFTMDTCIEWLLDSYSNAFWCLVQRVPVCV